MQSLIGLIRLNKSNIDQLSTTELPRVTGSIAFFGHVYTGSPQLGMVRFVDIYTGATHLQALHTLRAHCLQVCRLQVMSNALPIKALLIATSNALIGQ